MTALDHIKILDFSTLLPGPYATLTLADMGADIIKISSKSKADLVMDLKPNIADTGISANQAWLNRNKKTMFLNLKKKEAKDVIRKLIKEGYNCIVEQFRPGVMDKLGLGYKELSEEFPELIYLSLTGYGQTGPLKMRAGHDINYLARSGNMYFAGKKDIGPVLTNMQVADMAIGSLNSVIGLLVAIEYRNKTGIGQHVDIAMLDGLIPFNSMEGTNFLVDGKEPTRESKFLNGGSAYDFYKTKDDEYLSVGSLEPKFWAEFCRTLGHEEWIKFGAYGEEIAEIKPKIREIIESKTRAEWMELFKDKDCCVEPVLHLKEALLEDEHIKERELVVDVPMENGETVKQYAMPIHFSKTKGEYKFAGKEVGKDTFDILKELKYSKEEIESFEKEGLFE